MPRDLGDPGTSSSRAWFLSELPLRGPGPEDYKDHNAARQEPTQALPRSPCEDDLRMRTRRRRVFPPHLVLGAEGLARVLIPRDQRRFFATLVMTACSFRKADSALDSYGVPTKANQESVAATRKRLRRVENPACSLATCCPVWAQLLGEETSLEHFRDCLWGGAKSSTATPLRCASSLDARAVHLRGVACAASRQCSSTSPLGVERRARH